MPILLFLLELFVGTLTAWVLVFNLALYGRWPISLLEALFPCIWLLLLVTIARPRVRRFRLMSRREFVFARNTLVLGCLLGLLVLVASRPDADDVGYMYRVLIDASSPGNPFTVNPFIVPFQGRQIEIPFLSENEAYEAMVVVAAKIVRIDPLLAYHNVFAFLAAIVWIITYALLFRRFRVPRSKVWLALLTTITFLLLDGNLHRTFGNFSLIRIWQGKIIVWAILGPAFMFFVLRFLARPNSYRYCLLLATGALSFFVNRSSILLFAVLGISLAASYLLAFKRPRRRVARALIIVASVVPLWIVGAYIGIYSLPKGSSPSSVISEMSEIFSPSGPGEAAQAREPAQDNSWWSSLYALIIGSPWVLLRDVLFLTVLPFLAVPRPHNRFLLLLSLAVAFLAISPLTGPVWYFLFPDVYWRLYYALPLPLCVGLAIHLLSRPPSVISGRRPAVKLALVAAVVLATGKAVDRPVLSVANNVHLKSPFEYRFRDEPLRFSRLVAPRLYGKFVLAEDEIANILALTEYRSIDLVYARVTFPHVHQAISICRIDRRTAGDVRLLLDRGVDALIMRACDEVAVAKLRNLLLGYDLVEEKVAGAFSWRLYWVHRKPDSAS